VPPPRERASRPQRTLQEPQASPASRKQPSPPPTLQPSLDGTPLLDSSTFPHIIHNVFRHVVDTQTRSALRATSRQWRKEVDQDRARHIMLWNGEVRTVEGGINLADRPELFDHANGVLDLNLQPCRLPYPCFSAWQCRCLQQALRQVERLFPSQPTLEVVRVFASRLEESEPLKTSIKAAVTLYDVQPPQSTLGRSEAMWCSSSYAAAPLCGRSTTAPMRLPLIAQPNTNRSITSFSGQRRTPFRPPLGGRFWERSKNRSSPSWPEDSSGCHIRSFVLSGTNSGHQRIFPLGPLCPCRAHLT
jgi:hypothetical protein